MAEKHGRYANAKDVLPSQLVAEIQKYFEGMLWIPVRARRRRKTRKDIIRNRAILAAHARGVPTMEIARRFTLSPQRIRQILQEAKSKS